MALLLAAFDPTQVNPEVGIGMLPVGRHVVIAEASTLKNTKDGSSQYLEFVLRVVDGEHAGNTGALRFNLYHADDKVRQTAMRDFSRMCHAVNVLSRITATEQLHNLQFGVEVEKQKGQEVYTEVKRIFTANFEDPARAAYTGPKIGSSQPMQAQQPQQQVVQQPVQQQQFQPQVAVQQPVQPHVQQPVQQPVQQFQPQVQQTVQTSWTPNAAPVQETLPWNT